MTASKGSRAYPSIEPGRLRHRITIQQQTASTDISGSTIVWTTLLTCYAAIEPMRASDVIRAGQTISQVFIPVTIRYRTGIAPNMRVQWSGGQYVIQGIINPQERNILLTLMCLALGQNE